MRLLFASLLAVVVVALATLRHRLLGNALILAGVGVAALGSGLAGLGVGVLAPVVAGFASQQGAGWVMYPLLGLLSLAILPVLRRSRAAIGGGRYDPVR